MKPEPQKTPEPPATKPEASKTQEPPAAKPEPPTSGSKKTTTTPSRTISVDQEMIKSRKIFLTGDINDDSAKTFVQQMLFLEAEDPNLPVTIFINSGGGLVHSGLAMLDIMLRVSMPLKTVAYGRCFSIAAVLVAAGTQGQRSAFPHARLMIHEPSCSYPKLQASDIMIKAEELRHTKKVLEEVLSERTGRTHAEVEAAVSRDNYMSAAEAKEFGLIDHVLPSSKGIAGRDGGTRPSEVQTPCQAT